MTRLNRGAAWTSAQPMRVLGWVVAIGLTAYGSVLTVVGLLVEADVIDAAADADERAIAWHAFSGIRGSLCGAAPSLWPCGAVVHRRPNTAGNNATAGARERRLLPVRARPQQRSLMSSVRELVCVGR